MSPENSLLLSVHDLVLDIYVLKVYSPLSQYVRVEMEGEGLEEVEPNEIVLSWRFYTTRRCSLHHQSRALPECVRS